MDAQAALRDLALAMQAKSLEDAAVQLGILIDRLAEVSRCDLHSQVQSGHLEHALAKFEPAVAGITLIVAESACLDLNEIDEPGSIVRLNQHFRRELEKFYACRFSRSVRPS